MLLQYLTELSKKIIVLASGSPRRKEILTNLGLVFQVVPSTFPENLDKSRFTPEQYVIENSRIKAEEVATSLKHAGQTFDVVIGADSVVVLDGDILEKPSSEQHAFDMLTRLSGRSNVVFSGVSLVLPNPDGGFCVTSFSERTEVEFAPLTPDLINAYIATREPLDKAGAYGIQGLGSSFVRGIKGCYFNVMGFPTHAFCTQLLALMPRLLPPSAPANTNGC
eukprot:gnl/Hemi2/21311_TR7073_c0_g1_i1.p1 gnl/Hemi2/21311_TR7073_c0_g1~~gnl/Hemi2/21311_TR7073_c0_g1_i1.p1  ORF type:complete len:222 (-),score=43.85 gnl/Hemi2/21311_TR7073_c0_g1_i1:186-851(-)